MLSNLVGLLGPKIFVVPCLEVLSIGVIPAVRISQAVVSISLLFRLGPFRLLRRGGGSDLDVDGVLLDVVYVDEVSVISIDPKTK